MLNETVQEFITYYTAALKLNVSREDFANLLGVLPQSLIRKKNKISSEFSLNLPNLRKDPDNEITTKFKSSEHLLEEIEKIAKNYENKNKHKIQKSNLGKKVWIVSAAQNSTPVNDAFLKTLLLIKDHYDAEFRVIKYRYKNPTSIFPSSQKNEETWDRKLEPFLLDHELELNDKITICGEVKTQPTAVSPLSSLQSYTNKKSSIFGHSKIQWETVATPGTSLPKILATTGTLTIPNYTDSLAGKKGRKWHQYSAMIIEVSGDEFIPRYLKWSEEHQCIQDLNKVFYPDGRIESGVPILNLIPGDVHERLLDPKVKNSVFFGRQSMIKLLRPKNITLHDLLDFFYRNHHHRDNDFIRYAKAFFSIEKVEEELQHCANFLKSLWRQYQKLKIHVVKSNHDEAFDRWIAESNPKTDPINMRFFHYMKYHMLKNLKQPESERIKFTTIDPFEFWCFNPDEESGLPFEMKDRFRILKRDESFSIGGVNLENHGDKGSNGSMGSRRGFSKMGGKFIIGHSHTPGIYENVMQVGLCAYLDPEYVSGPSSWMHTMAIQYANGTETLCNVVNGRWFIPEFHPDMFLTDVMNGDT